MSNKIGPLAAALVITFGITLTGLEAQTIVTVDETNANWGFLDETSPGPGTVTSDFVLGPATPPRGSGSAHLALGAMTDGVIIATQNHVGTRLADITTLTYQSYQNISPQAISLQFNIDYDDADSTTSWQGRLVFEPLNSGTVLTDTWQSWDAMSGSWWSSGTPIVGDTPAASTCTQGSPCPWATLLTTYPNIAIHGLPLGLVFFKAGSGWPAGFDGNVDDFHIQTAAFNTVYDFETTVPVELQSFSID
ncbi:MAG: hypothetical protein K0U98_21035 [Deltaproteobacteria bacterium]|nr:hypothetical protein [Deltaproteobacteria bacterium]